MRKFLIPAISILLIGGYIAISSSESSDYQVPYELNASPSRSNSRLSTESNLEYEESQLNKEDAIREIEMEVFRQNSEIIEFSNEMILNSVGDE